MHFQIKTVTKLNVWSTLCTIVLCFFIGPVFPHAGHHTPAKKKALADSAEIKNIAPQAPTQNSGSMGIDEKPGATIPMDAIFTTETGDTVKLGSLIKGPTVLSFLYYGCSDACGTLLMGMATVLRTFADKPNTAPNVVFISVSDQETPAIAMKTHAIGFSSIEKPYPVNKWHFLTGSAQNIKAVADAVGFHFVKKGNDYDHPMGLIILSPQGKVMRYINGTDYLPMDVSISLMEAAKGSIQPSIARVLRYCFSYDPKSHGFVFNILRVSATVIFSLLAMFIAYLIVSTRKRRH